MTNGNDLREKKRCPLFLFPPYPHRGRRGINTKRGEAATALSKPAISAPHRILGAEMSRNKLRRERSDPHSGDGSATGMPAWMLAGWLPVAVSCISGREGAEGGRVATEPRKHATAKPGCPKVHSGGAITAGNGPRTRDRRECRGKQGQAPNAAKNGLCGAGGGYPSAATCSRLASNCRICS